MVIILLHEYQRYCSKLFDDNFPGPGSKTVRGQKNTAKVIISSRGKELSKQIISESARLLNLEITYSVLRKERLHL
jgi:hypothetical protein